MSSYTIAQKGNKDTIISQMREAIHDLDTRVSSIDYSTEISNLQSGLDTIETQNNELSSRVERLEEIIENLANNPGS